MTFVLFMIGVVAIGWFVPGPIVRRIPGRSGLVVGTLSALGAGVGFIWLAAQAGEAVGLGDAGVEFDRGFNAWKIMLLWAPAAALHHRRAQRNS